MLIGTYAQAWYFVIMVLLASFASLDFAELQNAWRAAAAAGRSGGDDVALSTPPILRTLCTPRG